MSNEYRSRAFEGDIASDIYDVLFKNDHDTMNFVYEFPDSFVDEANATIELNDGRGNSYSIRIIHTHAPAQTTKKYIAVHTACAIVNDDYSGIEYGINTINDWTDCFRIEGVGEGDIEFERCAISGLMSDCQLFTVVAI